MWISYTWSVLFCFYVRSQHTLSRQSTTDSIQNVLVTKIGIVVHSNFQEVILKFFVVCKGLRAEYRACGAYADKVDSHSDER